MPDLYQEYINSAVCDPVMGTPAVTSDCPPGEAPDPSFLMAPAPDLKIHWTRDGVLLAQARSLVRKRYSWRGYQVTTPSDRSERLTFVATGQLGTLGAISVGLDERDPLASESLYPEYVRMFRARKARLCEFTGLALEAIEQSRQLLAMMFHVAYLYAHRLADCSDLLIEVNPRHVGFYERMLGFRRIGPERSCPRVGAPAVLLWLPLSHAAQQIELHGGRGEAALVRSLYPLFFSPSREADLAAGLQAIR